MESSASACDGFDRARRLAAVEPVRPREALLLHEHDAPVGSIEPSLAARLAAAGLPVSSVDSAWVVAAPAEASLAAIARWLHEQGVCSRWRDELLPVRDGSGRPIACVERSVVRALGIPTLAVHLVGSAPGGRAWLQQRAFDKATDPGAWDTLVGGLVGVDESVDLALARETWEEAGLHLRQLEGILHAGRIAVRRPVSDGYMVEDIEVFHAVVPAGIEPRNQDGEVERFECLPLHAVQARLASGACTLEASLLYAFLMEQGVLATG